jgi:hypothetical protein
MGTCAVFDREEIKISFAQHQEVPVDIGATGFESAEEASSSESDHDDSDDEEEKEE